jgi:hypothetical protein
MFSGAFATGDAAWMNSSGRPIRDSRDQILSGVLNTAKTTQNTHIMLYLFKKLLKYA